MTLKLLDTFCKAGGASMGYHRAGFDVTGVDIEPQKRYPFRFIQADALEYIAEHGHEYDAIAASPPCQQYTRLRSIEKREYPDLVEPVRRALVETGRPYIIENVEGAPLINPIKLCGTMFGLRVIRHRIFETNFPLWFPPFPCNHWGSVSGNARWKDKKRIQTSLKNFDILTITGHDFIVSDARVAMGIDWMIQGELSQAIPPAYTEFIGRELIKHLERVTA